MFDLAHFLAPFGGHRGQTQERRHARRTVLQMLHYNKNVFIFKCWYLVRLTKMLWAAALLVSYSFIWEKIHFLGNWHLKCPFYDTNNPIWQQYPNRGETDWLQ